jgi:hypothetical protein
VVIIGDDSDSNERICGFGVALYGGGMAPDLRDRLMLGGSDSGN